jgi:hypothetical protein
VVAVVDLHERAEEPPVGRLIVWGVNVQVKPVGGLLVDERSTFPAKPPLEARVMVEVAAALIFAKALVGLAMRLIPAEAMLTVITVELDMALFEPPLPVMVTL